MKHQSAQVALLQPKLVEIYRRLEVVLDSIQSAIAAGVRPHDATGLFAEAYSLMEALPFTTDEFCVARKHLRNTVACLHSGECEASLRQLKLLKQTVCQN